MRKSLYLARCLSSVLNAEARDGGCPSAALRAFHPVAAIGTLSTSNLTRGFYRENLSVQREGSDRRALPLGSRSASKVPYEDTLLSSPNSLSANEKAEQLFISDTNHHRIIVVDGNGKIIDCIGSSPGFEDGTFEKARLYYPSSTVFDEEYDCLYVADSKNHVIRRASMSKRTVDTVGQNTDDKESTVWSRFLKWMQIVGLATKKDDNQQTRGAKIYPVLSNPCHLKLASDRSLVVASHGFETLWVLDPNSGECSSIPCQGPQAVYEEFERRSDASKKTFEALCLLHRTIKQLDMVSRVANVHSNIFYLDTEGHVVRKMDLQTGSISTLQLSDFDCLGLPAWWSIHPLSRLNMDREHVSIAQSTCQEDVICHRIQVQPGRCLICIDPVLPEGMTLAAPVEDRSVWRQARGSIVELSTFGGKLLSHKVSDAQQWVDDFEELETVDESFDGLVGPQQSEHGLPLYAFIDASLGCGEVLVDAVLYLKHVSSCSTHLGSEGSKTERASNDEDMNISPAEKNSGDKGNARNQEDSLRLRHLHARVRIEVTNCGSSERTNVIRVQL